MTRFGAFRHYFGLARTEPRLRCLLHRFRFAPLREVLAVAGFI
jgi:hypothetical protein